MIAAVFSGGAVRPSGQLPPEYSPIEPDTTIVVAAGIFGLEEFFTGQVEESRDTAWEMINFARNYIGCRYVYATHGPNTFEYYPANPELWQDGYNLVPAGLMEAPSLLVRE